MLTFLQGRHAYRGENTVMYKIYSYLKGKTFQNNFRKEFLLVDNYLFKTQSSFQLKLLHIDRNLILYIFLVPHENV